MWIWFLGIIAKLGAIELAKKLLDESLSKKLLKVAKKWADNLPEDTYVNAETIWVDPFINIEHLEKFTHRKNLCCQIEANEIPSEEVWFKAFIEKWRDVKANIENPQAFFMLEENQATPHIHDLARRIFNEFTQDPIKARRAIVDALYKKGLLNKVDLENKLHKCVRQQIEKQKNCKKYIPDIYCELDQVKDNARYFVAPVTFWPNAIEQINRLNYVFLNSLLNQVGLDEFKIEIPESLRNISHVKEIESKGTELIQLLNGRLNYLKTLGKSGKYYSANTGWKLEGTIHKVTWAIEDIITLINCICAKVFCITSKAGQGKTNFVCDLVENVLNKRSSPCLYFNARDFNYTSLDRIDEYIVKTVCCDSQFCNLTSFLRTIEAICTEQNTTFTIIIDGLNEHTKIAEFSDTLEKLIERLLTYSFIRIILTCRTEYFDQRFGNLKVASFKERIFFFENINTQMHEVKKERLLNGYLKFFNISCRSIAHNVRKRLASDPLLLRIFCEAYGDHKASTPIELPIVYHIYKEELFRTYFEKKLKEIEQKDLSTEGLRIGYKRKYRELLCDIIAKMIKTKKYENILVTVIPSTHLGVLEQMLDEDIIFRKDLTTQDDILNPAYEVINFTFDEFRDYLIANYLINNIFEEDPGKLNGLLTELIVPESPIAEGVSRFIFCISKRKNSPTLNKLIKNTSWYDYIFLDSIFSVSDDLIGKEDIDTICRRFKQSIYESSFIIYSLMHRFDTDAFKNLNIDVLITILIDINEGDYDKYVIPVFEGRDDYSYARSKRYFTQDIGNFTNQLSEILSNTDLTKEKRFVTLFDLLIYLFPIKDNHPERPVFSLYNRFALKYPNYAIEQLMKAVGAENVFTEFFVWKTITNICDNNSDFPNSFVKATLYSLMNAQYDIHNRQSALSETLRGDSTEARKFYFLKHISINKPEIFTSQEIAYINRHYDYFFSSR